MKLTTIMSMTKYYLHKNNNNNSLIIISNVSAVAAATVAIDDDVNSGSSEFSVYDLITLCLSTAYFVLGFPTNLLSVIVCLKSLFERSSSSNKQSQKLINRRKNSDYFYGKPSPLLDRRSTMIVAGGNCNQQQQQQTSAASVSSSSSSSNPHRKCFELYLIEISICDILILSYYFLESVLSLLAHYKLIDSIYSELTSTSKFMCRFIIGFNRILTLLHNWLLASMAITRCYAVFKPINSTAYFSTKFYYRLNLSVLFTLILLFSLSNLYGVLLLEYYTPADLEVLAAKQAALSLSSTTTAVGATYHQHQHQQYTKPECTIAKHLYEKYDMIDFYINLTLGIIGYSLPCFITLIINLLLIYKLRPMLLMKTDKFRKNLIERRHFGAESDHAASNSIREQKVRSVVKFDKKQQEPTTTNNFEPFDVIITSKNNSGIRAKRIQFSKTKTSNNNNNNNNSQSASTSSSCSLSAAAAVAETKTAKSAVRSNKQQQQQQQQALLRKQLSNASMTQNSSSNTVSSSSRKLKTRYQFFKTTSSLLTLSFAYLICYLPFSFVYLFVSLNMLHLTPNLVFFLHSLRYLNHTLNFYIYYCTGKRFRNCVKRFLGCHN